MICAICGKPIDTTAPVKTFKVFPESTVRKLFDFHCDFKTTERAANIVVSKKNEMIAHPMCLVDDTYFFPILSELHIENNDDRADLKWLDDLMAELYSKEDTESTTTGKGE